MNIVTAQAVIAFDFRKVETGEIVNVKEFAKTAKRRGFEPSDNATCVMKLSDAVVIGERIDAYADYRYLAVPYHGTPDGLAPARLRNFFSCARTADGSAGNGYTLEFLGLSGEAVVIEQRYSLAD